MLSRRTDYILWPSTQTLGLFYLFIITCTGRTMNRESSMSDLNLHLRYSLVYQYFQMSKDYKQRVIPPSTSRTVVGKELLELQGQRLSENRSGSVTGIVVMTIHWIKLEDITTLGDRDRLWIVQIIFTKPFIKTGRKIWL